MSNHISAYPLQWPDNWPRARYQDHSRFKCTDFGAKEELKNELRMLCATNVILSTNVALRQDGDPYANQKTPDDPGVAVYFKLKGEPRVIACDTWDRIRDNMRAISKSVGALRGIKRWGCSTIMEKAFTGFKALPSPEMVNEKPWYEWLGWAPHVLEEYTKEDISERRIKLARLYHPDSSKQPDGERMARINAACDEAIELLERGSMT